MVISSFFSSTMTIFRNCSRWRFRRLFSIILRCHQRSHLCLIFMVLTLATLLSSCLPFGLIFNLLHIRPERPALVPYRNSLIEHQKLEQKIAFHWLDSLWKNAQNFSEIISNETFQSRFYHSIRLPTVKSNFSSYTLFERPKRIFSSEPSPDEEILISILYSRQDTDYDQGKFYVGQVLYRLLKTYQRPFIITLCENENSDILSSKTIDLIRRLVPVFVVKSSASDVYEREKQAHLQCILANFQSFPQAKYLVLLQDDAEPIGDHFYSRLRSVIDLRIKRQWPVQGQRNQPAFVKIYHPRWLTDYLHPSFYIIVQLIATSLFLTGILFGSIHLARCSTKTNKQCNRFSHLSFVTSWLSRLSSIEYTPIDIFLYFLLISLILVLINHSNVSWTWRSLHPSFYAIYPAPSCCLPGVIYFRSTYSTVIEYLQQTECHSKYAIDTALDDLPRKTDLRTFLIEPNLVHHIGLYSRLHHNYINPYLLD